MMKPITKQAYRLMHEGILALAEIERNGICIDLNYCEKAQIEITEKIKTEEDILHEYDEVRRWKNRFGAKFNMDSDHQLAKVLYEDMGIEVSKVTDSGNPSVDQSALEGIEHPMIKSLLRIRKLKKTRSTYLGNIVRESVNGLLHPFFNLHTVRTYRSSSQDPNFQNIPVRDPEIREIIRRVFIPRPGHRIGGSDYSGIEVKISACVTGDTLIETTEGSRPILDVINCVAQKKEVYVYGYDIEKSRVTISRVVEGGLTRKKAEVWKVTLDNKKVIKATTDHDFLLRSGEYTPLSELKPGDSLMPFIAWNKGIPRSEETKVKIRGSLKKTRESKKLYNHKVESIEFYGFEDVYNITVEKIHNYAVGAGVIIKNCYHRDPTMLKYLNDPMTDMHRDMAMDCYLISDPKQVTKNVRYCSKNMFVFPEFYGDYYKNCAKFLWEAILKMELTLVDGTPLKIHLKDNGIKSYEKFEKHIQDVEDRFWNEKFFVYKKWKENWVKAYERRGYFDTLTGFRCSGVMGKNDVINYPVQGVAFHCLLWSITQLQRWVKEQKLASKIIGQIHDEITKDLHADEFMYVLKKEKQIMCEDIREEWEWLKIVPLDIEASFTDVDRPWNEVKEVKIV